MAGQAVNEDVDDELWADVKPRASRQLLQAALECFASRGYHATTTREIAQRCGLSPGGVYVHYASKIELLYAITLAGHHSSLRVVEEAVLVVEDHAERIREIVRALAKWHVDHQDLARVVAYEQRALLESHHKTLRPLRRRFYEMVEAEVNAGNATDQFDVSNPTDTARALLSLCTDIARWYRPDHDAGAEELADAYAGMALRLLHG